jgi:hypothetical protein
MFQPVLEDWIFGAEQPTKNAAKIIAIRLKNFLVFMVC